MAQKAVGDANAIYRSLDLLFTYELAMLESMEKSEKRLQEKLDELMSSIDG